MACVFHRSVVEFVRGKVPVRFGAGLVLYAQYALRVWFGERASLCLGGTLRSVLHDLVCRTWGRAGIPGQPRQLSRSGRTEAGHVCSDSRRATDLEMLNLKSIAPSLSRALGFLIPLLLALHWPVIACHVSAVLMLTLLRIALLGSSLLLLLLWAG